MASSFRHGADDDSGVIHAYMPNCTDSVKEATTWLRAGFAMNGFDMNTAAASNFASFGPKARAVSFAADALENSAVVILMVQNAAQADDDILFASGNGADALSDHTVVILSSTVPPSFVRILETKVQNLRRGISLLDAPVSGGVARAANGTLAVPKFLIMCSGQGSSLAKSRAVLLAMAGPTTNLHTVQGGIGAASSVKLVNQLLAGVYIATAAEAMALAARLALHTRLAFEILIQTDAWSWIMENRTGQMLDADWTPHSALSIFVKDVG
ncbi:hypothetical protein G3M48_000350 [Beauveria asiatica]|uniref:Uncharacterized protein n=1 Tax=Beauveria asiatica TaxID=1069075 RepID=A0AAW0RGI4_9HYPO